MTENKRFFPAALSDGTLRQVAMVCMLIVSGAVIAGVVISKRKTRQ